MADKCSERSAELTDAEQTEVEEVPEMRNDDNVTDAESNSKAPPRCPSSNTWDQQENGGE